MYEFPAEYSGNGPNMSIATSSTGAFTVTGHNLAVGFEVGFFCWAQTAQVLHFSVVNKIIP